MEQDVAYYYKVTAMTAAGESTPSEVVSALALPRETQRLSPPASFKAEAPLGTMISSVPQWAGIYLRWCPNPAREGVTGYNVYRSRNSMDPFNNRIAWIPPICLDGRHRCEIPANGVVVPTTSCQKGVSGNCAIVDTTVTQATANVSQVYYYLVTAERDQEESGFSNENQGRPNCQNCFVCSTCSPSHSWAPVFDPDNFPELICGDEFAALREQAPIVTANRFLNSGSVPLQASEQAPYRVIGQAVGPPTPNAAPRFVYLHLDHLGRPRVITDAGGNLISKHHYMPFGEEMPSAAQGSANKRQFTGHERDDETGLDYMVARYYSSSLGRFIAVDPGDDTDLALPQSWNLYRYASNNPLLYVDPDGGEIETSTPSGWLHFDLAYSTGGPLVMAELEAHMGADSPDLEFAGVDASLKSSDRGKMRLGQTDPILDSEGNYEGAKVRLQEGLYKIEVDDIVIHELGHVNAYRTKTKETVANDQSRRGKQKNHAHANAFAKDDKSAKEGKRPKREWKGSLKGGAPTTGPRYAGDRPKVLIDGVDVSYVQ